MFILTRQDSRFLGILGRAVALSGILLAGSTMTGAQAGDTLVRVLEVKRSAMPQEVSRLAERGYDISLARLDPGLLIAQKSRAVTGRSYLFVEDLGTFLSGKRLERGYRLLPQTLSPCGKPYCAVFEKVEADEQVREYAFLDGSSADDVAKKAKTALGEGFVPVAINTESRAVAVFERRPDAGSWKVLATKSTGTMEKELAAAGAEGYRVAAASGGSELSYALVQSSGAPTVEYRLLAATSSKTLERELNQVAAQGFRFVPLSLAALAGGGSVFMARASNEGVIVVEKMLAPEPIIYKVVGARRVSTIEKEVMEAASQGFSIVTAVLGYEETVVILASPRGATTDRPVPVP